jgi:hypothetical protein
VVKVSKSQKVTIAYLLSSRWRLRRCLLACILLPCAFLLSLDPGFLLLLRLPCPFRFRFLLGNLLPSQLHLFHPYHLLIFLLLLLGDCKRGGKVVILREHTFLTNEAANCMFFGGSGVFAFLAAPNTPATVLKAFDSSPPWEFEGTTVGFAHPMRYCKVMKETKILPFPEPALPGLQPRRPPSKHHHFHDAPHVRVPVPSPTPCLF